MPEFTKRYNLEYFKRGSHYSAQSDFRRFTTLDYNMESYVGIVGVGIIDGWEVQDVGGMAVEILPGKGLIDDMAVESPYVFKKRSEMEIPEREVEVIRTDRDEIPEPNLSSVERAKYIQVIQAYDPLYSPFGPIENTYVKAVIPHRIQLFDNNDSYIYAKKEHNETYPRSIDYPPLPDSIPLVEDYPNYEEFLEAKQEYDNAINNMREYEWRENHENQFTSVTFESSLSPISSNKYTLLARVVTRNGIISEIDTRNIDSLSNMESTVKKLARDLIEGHKHGGDGPFDPSHIDLSTDIRSTMKLRILPENVVVYKILSKNRTSVSQGHQHSYYVNDKGEGYTVDVFGSGGLHFHKINKYIVQENADGDTAGHRHTIEGEGRDLTDSSMFNVFLSGEIVGDQSSIEFSADKKTIELNQIVSSSLRTYRSSFTFDFFNGASNEKVFYTYQSKEYSLLTFMLKMMKDFDIKYPISFENEDVPGEMLAGVPIEVHPFIFYDKAQGSIVGVTPLVDQANIGDNQMKKVGDAFTFAPGAARNITVRLLEVPSENSFDVSVEFLGKADVTGKIQPKNVLYLNASKIISGVFDIERIPFIDHLGRIDEACAPIPQNMISSNGISYRVIPSITSVALGHSHNVFLNSFLNGVSQQTFVGEDPVYYGTGKNGEDTYLISHLHGIDNGKVSSSSSAGLIAWQNDINSNEVINTSEHIHELILPKSGDAKIIYAIQETKNGDIYVSTSDGFYLIPKVNAYIFVINGVTIEMLGDDLWELLLKAKQKYELETETPLSVSESVYKPQLNNFEKRLQDNNSTILLKGSTLPDLGQDQIMIKRVFSLRLPNLSYLVRKSTDSILPTDIVIESELMFASTGEIIEDIFDITEENLEDVVQNYLVHQNLHKISTPTMLIKEGFSSSIDGEPNGNLLGIPITDTFIAGHDIIVKTRNIRNLNTSWDKSSTPDTGNIKGMSLRNDEIWAYSNKGVIVSRKSQNGKVFQMVKTPGFSRNISGLVVDKNKDVLCATSNRIFKSQNGGATWHLLYEAGPSFSEMTIDEATHKIYAVLSDGKVLYSHDNGLIWHEKAHKPDGDFSELFVFNDNMFVSSSKAVYQWNGNNWEIVLPVPAYSFETKNDKNDFFIGTKNRIYKFNDGSFDLVFSFEGHPLPAYDINGVSKSYGYTYNNIQNAFWFKEFLQIGREDEITASVDYSTWYADRGPWNGEVDYEVVIDDRIVYSKIDGTDERGNGFENFEIDPSNGSLDFGAETNLKFAVSVYDIAISVDNSSGFSIGDHIIIKGSPKLIEIPEMPDLNSDAPFHQELQQYLEKVLDIGRDNLTRSEMSFSANIKSISGDILFLDTRSEKEITLPATVRKLPKIDGNTTITINVFDSMLFNQGENTHEEVEDSLSTLSDLRPYQLNNSYLSNILQLTQAVRYAYPEIGEGHKNNLYYDFHYDTLELQQKVDLATSEMFSQRLYDSGFKKRIAKNVNKILIGYGGFQNHIFVGTDVGLFWATITEGFEGNWSFVAELPFAIYDLIITENEWLNVGSNNGIYVSQNIKEWTHVKNPLTRFPIQTFSFRWNETETVSVLTHRARLSNDDYDQPSFGYLYSDTPLYGDLTEGRSIKLTGVGVSDGEYVIHAKTEKQIILKEGFKSLTEAVNFNSVEIEEASWWEKFKEDSFSGSASINNTLLAGGKNKIIYRNGGNAWNESKISTELSSFNVNDLMFMDNGSMLASANGVNGTEMNNQILKSSGIGNQWDVLINLQEIQIKIINSNVNEFGNTKLTVEYTKPKDRLYPLGDLNLKTIALFSDKKLNAIVQGFIVWNHLKNNNHEIIVRGESFHNAYLENQSEILIAKVYPLSINSISQTSNKEILLGTDEGIYTDNKSIDGASLEFGQIINVGDTGVVSSIDINGIIESVRGDSRGNLQFSLKSPKNIKSNSLKNGKLFITDTYPVQEYRILSNTGKSYGGEFSATLDEIYTSGFSLYNGKKVKIVIDTSTINISFKFPVKRNEFKDGQMHVLSQDIEPSKKTYSIFSNDSTSVTVSEVIIPKSTARSSESGGYEDVVAGQRVLLIRKDGRMTLYVGFSRTVAENALTSKRFVTPRVSAKNKNGLEIYSNTKDTITLNTYEDSDYTSDFQRGESFKIKGSSIFKMPSFNSRKTSTDSSHYHLLELVGDVIGGEVNSISISDGSVNVGISNVKGWNDILNVDSELLKGASIRFYNQSNVGFSFSTVVRSLNEHSIVVNVGRVSDWDESSYNKDKVSNAWLWEIDATHYGYTSGTYYEDFLFAQIEITDNVSRNDGSLRVSDSSSLVNGDKVLISDDFGTNEINYISSIESINIVNLRKPVLNEYFMSKKANIKVLRDFFSNNHIHQVKANEVARVLVSEYNEKGYPSIHSHRCLPHLSSVNKVISEASTVAVGNNSKIYHRSSDKWIEKTDLNEAIDIDEEIEGISESVFHNGNAIVGTTNGFIFYPYKTNNILELISPSV